MRAKDPLELQLRMRMGETNDMHMEAEAWREEFHHNDTSVRL